MSIFVGLLLSVGIYSQQLFPGVIASSMPTTSEISFLLTSTGDGSGVSQLDLIVSETTTLTLDGTARFYSNEAGDADESTTWEPTSGGTRTMYVKCPSGTSNLTISANTITSFRRNWEDSSNKYSMSGDITQLTALNTYTDYVNNTTSGNLALLPSLAYIVVWGSNTISGDISGLTSLTYLSLKGSANITGSVASLTSLTHLEVDITNTLSGSIAGLTSLDYLYVSGTNTLSGSVAGLTSLTRLQVTGSNTLTGSVAALTSLTYLYVIGNNTVSGDINALVSDLTNCTILGDNQMDTYTSGATWGNATVSINPAVGYGYSSTEIDNILIDMAASSPGPTSKVITLQGENAARTSASDAAVTDLQNNHLCTINVD